MLYLGSQFFIELLLFVEQIINLATRLLTLPHLGSQFCCYLYREEYLTKPYYKPRFSQWVASSKFVEFLNYFNCYNCFFHLFFIGNSTHGTQNILQFKEFEFSFVAPDFLH